MAALALFTALSAVAAPVTIDLNNSATSADRTLYLQGKKAYGGLALVAGDLDGNGVDEMIIGSPFAQGEYGRVDIVYNATAPISGATEELDFENLPEDPAVTTLVGTEKNGWFGYSVALGDFNADGVDDLAVGAPNAVDLAGRVYLFLGENNGLLPGQRTAASADIVLRGAGEYDGAGSELTFGDLNGDNRDDLVIAAPYTNKRKTFRYADRVYVLYGSTDRAPGQSLDLGQDSDLFIKRVIANYRSSINSNAFLVRDVIGDEIPDLIIGCQYSMGGYGMVYILRGARRPRGATVDLLQEADLTISDDREADLFGASVDVGDVDGDGDNDLVIGGPAAYSSLYGKIALLLFNGKPDPQAPVQTRLGVPTALYKEVVYRGHNKGEQLGQGLIVGDCTGDGLSDIAVGALYGRDPKEDRSRGRVYVLPGRAVWPDDVSDIAALEDGLTIIGAANRDNFGMVLTLGDFGGGKLSLVSSAWLSDGPIALKRKSSGAVYQFSQTLWERLSAFGKKSSDLSGPGTPTARDLYFLSRNWMKPARDPSHQVDRSGDERVGREDLTRLYQEWRKPVSPR